MINQFKRILVPTDLTENSRRGLDYAVSLASESGAELLVLHVASPLAAWQIPEELAFFDSRSYAWELDRLLKEAALNLNRFLGHAAPELHRISIVRTRVVLGEVVQNILQVACQEEAGVIVMSPRPHGAIRRFLQRSVTDRIARQAPCPVLSVCPPRTKSPRHGRCIPLHGGLLQGSQA